MSETYGNRTLRPEDVTPNDMDYRTDCNETDPDAPAFLRNKPAIFEYPLLPLTPGDYKVHVAEDGEPTFVHITDEVTSLPVLPAESGSYKLVVDSYGAHWEAEEE